MEKPWTPTTIIRSEGASSALGDDSLAGSLVRGWLEKEANNLHDTRSVVDEPTSDVILQCENRAEEWHFDEWVHSSKVEALKNKGRDNRHREAMAQETLASLERETEEHINMVLDQAAAEEVRRAKRLAKLREDLIETQHHIEELEEDCNAQVAEVHREIDDERSRRNALELEVRDEQQHVDASQKRIENLQNVEVDAMRSKDKRICALRTGAQAEVQKIQRAAESQVRDLERQLREDLGVLELQQDRVIQKTTGVVRSHVLQRQDALGGAESLVSGINRQVQMDLAKTNVDVLDMESETFSKVQEVQAQDFAHEANLKDSIDNALAAVESSLEKQRHAAVIEHDHRNRLIDTEQALGTYVSSFTKSSQFGLHFHPGMHAALATVGVKRGALCSVAALEN